MQKIRVNGVFRKPIVVLVDDEDVIRIKRYEWHLGGHDDNVVATNIDGKTTSMGRFLLNYKGPLEVDHKDHNCFNFQKNNLRIATRQQQMANSKPQLERRFKGTTKVNKKWKAAIKVNGKRIHLGYFFTEIEAAKAYDVAAKKHFGEFAYLNFRD